MSGVIPDALVAPEDAKAEDTDADVPLSLAVYDDYGAPAHVD